MIGKQLVVEQGSRPSPANDTRRSGRDRTAIRVACRALGFLTILISVGVLGPPGASAASAGETDISFGVLGEVRQDVFGGWDDFGNAAAIQGDGKILVAGQWGFSGPGNGYFALLRFNPSGSLDTSFGAGGRISTSFNSNNSVAEAVAIQTNGRIVVAGTDHADGGSNFAVARYHSNGTPDASFSGDGKLTANFGGNDDASSVAIQSDGKIVVAGTTSYPDSDNFAVVRFNAYGAPDNDFDGDGRLITGIGGNERANAVTIQSDGKIVVAGRRYILDCSLVLCDSDVSFALTRYNGSDGSLDDNFDGDGKLITGIGGSENAQAVAIQADGKIVAAGTRNDDSFALVRYNRSDGSLDTNFDHDGKVVTALRPNTFGQAMAIQANGKIVVAGYTYAASNLGYDFALTRYNAVDGALDTSFGGDGEVRTNIGFYDGAEAVAIQRDGKIVAAGWGGQYTEQSGTRADFALVRYHAVTGNVAPATTIHSTP